MQPFVALAPGTWADWVNAGATALAGVIAIVLLAFGLNDRRRANEDRERDQARKVWVWASHKASGSQVAPSGTRMIICKVENRSEDPITQVRLGDAALPTEEFARSSPRWEVLPPGIVQTDFPYGDGLFPAVAAVQLVFTDAAGLQWRRDSLGHLQLWSRPIFRRQ
jgi:hypothetical protein